MNILSIIHISLNLNLFTFCVFLIILRSSTKIQFHNVYNNSVWTLVMDHDLVKPGKFNKYPALCFMFMLRPTPPPPFPFPQNFKLNAMVHNKSYYGNSYSLFCKMYFIEDIYVPWKCNSYNSIHLQNQLVIRRTLLRRIWVRQFRHLCPRWKHCQRPGWNHSTVSVSDWPESNNDN